MFPRLSVVVCGLALGVGCAAEEIDGPSPGSSSGNAPSGSGTGSGAASGGGGTGATTGGVPSTAGTSSGTGNSPGAAGTPSTAGSSGAGAGGTGSAGGSAGGVSGGGSSSGSSGSGSLGGKPSITLPFTENFEDGVADGFLPWNEDMTQGTWAVVTDGASKVYRPTAAVSDLEFAVGGVTAWTDVVLKVKVKLADADSGAQVVVRFKEPKTYLFVEMGEGKYKLRGRADGSTTDLVSPSPKPTIVAGTWYTVGITIKGTNATLTLDSATIGTATCNALISNGGVALGVAEGSVAFDDLSVTAAP